MREHVDLRFCVHFLHVQLQGLDGDTHPLLADRTDARFRLCLLDLHVLSSGQDCTTVFYF